MSGNKSVTSNFQSIQYTLATTAMPSAGGTVSGRGSYNTADVITITATPAEGYTITGWSDDATGTSSSISVTMDGNKSVTETERVTVKLPKLFSPDNRGDASTETWRIENADKLDGAVITVYNRQGQKVYSAIGYNTPWRGTSGGSPLPDGGIQLHVVYPDNQKQTGSVTIARVK
jgi:xyloglucan-specific exo-beta-1,4-glucanase